MNGSYGTGIYDHSGLTTAEDVRARAAEMLTQTIERGREKAITAIEKIIEMTPADVVVPTPRLTFSDELEMVLGETSRRMHQNALYQSAERAGIPPRFVSKLRTSSWGRRLLAENLRTIFTNAPDRVLVRSVGDEVRGVLSDTFRRLDAAEIISAFARACGEVGCVPVDGVYGDLTVSVRAVLPDLIWVAGDPVVLGLSARTSDFGEGAVSVSFFLLRVRCTNGAMGENVLRAVHLGKRLSDDQAWSEKTMRLDTAATASAVEDVVRAQLSPAAIEERRDLLERAYRHEIDPKPAFDALKKVLTKKEHDAALEVWAFGDESKVPAGKTAARLSNAISWIAKSSENAERRQDLERVSWELLQTPTAKAATLSAILGASN